MGNLENWARDINREIEEKQNSEAYVRQEFLVRRELIKNHGPQLWDELIENFRACCDAFNTLKRGKIMILEMSGPDLFVVRRDGRPETLVALHEHATHDIKVSS